MFNYGSGNYNGYGYGQPNMYQYPQAHSEIVKVKGYNGASAFQMAPNSSVLMLDENDPVVYLKQTDGAGYPTITAYDIMEHKQEPQINMNDMKMLERRIARLEEVVNESNSQPIKRAARQQAIDKERPTES